jgi:DNA-binding transcriptional LysR family regulator
MRASLRMLRYVVAAADAGSVTEGARALHVSQAAVSAAIAQLEAMAEFSIFVRHHAKGMSLTDAGARLMHEARGLLAHGDAFNRSMASMGGAPTGEIAVGCFVTLAARFMPSLLSDFATLFPGITVRLQEGDQADIVAGLQSGRLEVALSYDFALPPEVAGDVLTRLPPHVLVAADHRLAGAASVPLRAFEDEPFLLLDLPLSVDYFAGLFASCGVQPRIAMRTPSFELIRGMVARGHGYTIHNVLPRTRMTYDGGEVAALPIQEDLAPVQVMRLRLARMGMRPAVAAFWGFLEGAFGAA